MVLMKIRIYSQIVICVYYQIVHIHYLTFFSQQTLHHFLSFSLHSWKTYTVTALWRISGHFLQNSISFFFFSYSFILKAINKIIIWLLFLFWSKFTQILKLNMCNLSCGGFKVVFYGIDLIKRADRLISLKFVFMYLYSMRHYRLTKFILELIPFDKMILIRA